MFSDPQSVMVNAVSQSLPRIGTIAPNSGRFQKDDGSYLLTLSHVVGKRTQRKLRLDHSKIITDPFATDRGLPVNFSIFTTLDVSPIGYTNAELVNGLVAVADWLKASTNANATMLVGGEV
jgi:hypothetical protein